MHVVDDSSLLVNTAVMMLFPSVTSPTSMPEMTSLFYAEYYDLIPDNDINAFHKYG